METFRLFLTGLFPGRYCIECLTRLADTPETTVRERLQTLIYSLDVLDGECHSCRQPGRIYRLRPQPAQNSSPERDAR